MKTSTTCNGARAGQRQSAYHEEVESSHPFDVDQRSTLIVDELSGKLGSLIGVNASDVLKKRGVVGRVVDALGVDDNLGELTRLGEAGAVGKAVNVSDFPR